MEGINIVSFKDAAEPITITMRCDEWAVICASLEAAHDLIITGSVPMPPIQILQAAHGDEDGPVCGHKLAGRICLSCADETEIL